MATIVTGAKELAYNQTVGLLAKLVKQYLDSSELRMRFDVFDAEAVPYGLGYEQGTFLPAKKLNDGSSKAEEHGAFPPKIMALVVDDVVGGQWGVTLDPRRVDECVGDMEATQRYAAELTETLYQGWVVAKNTAVGEAASKLIAKKADSGTDITLNAGEDDKFAIDVIAAMKGKVEDLKEGVKGSDYGNTFVGDSELAARDIVIVMSNAFAAFLDVHGFAKAFSPQYLETSRVRRVTSSKINDGTVLITDARNIKARPKYERFVSITNSDGSENFFLNKYEYIAAMVADYVAYPFYVIGKAVIEKAVTGKAEG